MKAAVRQKYGGPEVLTVKEVDQPVAGPHEVLIKVYATTVNRTDWGVITGLPYVFRFFTGLFKPASAITGTDFAGKIVTVGEGIDTFKPGDRVWGFNDHGRFGSHAQYMKTGIDQIATIPEGISYQKAVGCAEGAHYAINFINKVKLNAGDKVLVNGATGAIGSAAVQLLKERGVVVTAVCPGAYLDVVRSMGAEVVIDYQSEDFTQINERFHFVFDAVGKSTFGRCKPLLIPGGIYISSELGPRAENPFLALITPLLGGKKVVFPLPVDIKKSLTIMQELLAQGKFEPLMDRTYPLDEIAEAYRYVNGGQKIGNVIVDMWGESESTT